MAHEEGKRIAQLLGVCLAGESGKEHFKWFDEMTEQKRATLDQAARRPPEGLMFTDVGRKAWYNKVKEPNEAAWEAQEPPPENQKWSVKLTQKAGAELCQAQASLG